MRARSCSSAAAGAESTAAAADPERATRNHCHCNIGIATAMRRLAVAAALLWPTAAATAATLGVFSSGPAALTSDAATLPSHLQHLRSAASLAAPDTVLTLSDATALHTEAKRRAARIQRHYGHTAPAALPSLRQQFDPAAGAVLRPADFGADPTGATDSTAAFAKAIQALLWAPELGAGNGF